MTIKEVSEKYGISQDTLRYYERVNVIPKVTRTSGGIRDYQEEDLRWVELAVCMRNAGLPIESLIEYQRLFRAGDSTIPARLELLNEQMDILQKQKEQIEETMDKGGIVQMAKLVAFYSRADENYFGGSMKYIQIGNTEKAAKMIADMTGADLFKIEQKIPYAADYNTCIAQAKEDKQTGKRPEILNLPQDIDQYDEIYLGYPNYWGTMPMAVYTFLESYDFTGKKIHPFCTHEGSGLSNTESDIKKSAKGAVIEKGIAIHGSSVDQAKDVLERWIQK